MTKKIFFTALVTLFFTFFTASGQTIDSVQQSVTTIQADTSTHDTLASPHIEDDFSPGLLFFGLIGLGLVCICIGIGIALIAAGLFLIFGLITTGVLSASILVGLNKKSFSRGFKTFVLLSASIGGLCICTAVFYLANRVFDLHFTTRSTVIVGAISGLVAGVLLGQTIYIITRKLTNYFRSRLEIA